MLDRQPRSINPVPAFEAPAQETEIGLPQLLAFLRRQQWVIALAVAATFVLGLVYLVITPPTYMASTTLLIDQSLVVLFPGRPQIPAEKIPAERKDEHRDAYPDLQMLGHDQPPHESLLLHDLIGDRHEGNGNAPAKDPSTPDERRPPHRARAFPPDNGFGASTALSRHVDVVGS